jgi:replication factor C small subunit
MVDIWTEKYRPKKLDEVYGQVSIIKRLKSFVKAKSLPHLLFAGPAGTGKTTCALAIARELYGEGWSHNLLETNASDERGIDIIRGKIKDFARTMPIGGLPFKLILLDEADSLTKDAQHALRRTMEKYAATCRFILDCNYSSKIIDPIQSRCAVFRFKPLEEGAVIELLKDVSKKEGLKVSGNALKILYEVSKGDLKK